MATRAYMKYGTPVNLALNGILALVGLYLIGNGAYLVWIPEQRTGKKVADSCRPGRSSVLCREVYELEDGELTSIPVSVPLDGFGTPDGVTRIVPDNRAPFSTGLWYLYRNKKTLGMVLIIVGLFVLLGPVSVAWMRYHRRRE